MPASLPSGLVSVLAMVCFCLSPLEGSAGRLPDVSRIGEAVAEKAGPLVGVSWLERNLKSPDLLILDASSAQAHKAGHIPGAVPVDFYSYGAREASAAEVEKRLQSWGVSPGKRILVYDQGGSYLATRVFYDLYAYGVPLKDLHLLDGGFAGWKAASGAVTAEATPPPVPGRFQVANRKEEVRVQLPDFLNASGDPKGNALVEALDANWHFGEIAPFGRAGHIPYGLLLPAVDFYRPDKSFKSPEEIRRMLDYLGIRPEQQIYTYCGGGVAASVPFFALKFLLNFPKVKLFEGSELEWLRDPRGLPYWTYDAPFLLRDSAWLQGWGGGMLRQYGLAQVSILDVRPAEAFKAGHVPFAANLPAERFKSHLKHPEKLAELLGLAGVHPSHEAVVVSGAGLTEASALAFLMLEQAGHSRASILMDSMESWAKRGFPVQKEVAEGSKEPAPKPTAYPRVQRTAPVVADPRSTKGLYPKVFIASGNALPAKVPEGKVVHVPYRSLLEPDGTPKPAKEIWKLLVKAGVPRFGELLCLSEEPGEAAANYFLLKLMGFPDVKVLVD